MQVFVHHVDLIMKVGDYFGHLSRPPQKLSSLHDISPGVLIFYILLYFLTFYILIYNEDCLFVDIFCFPIINKLYHLDYLGMVYLSKNLLSVCELQRQSFLTNLSCKNFTICLPFHFVHSRAHALSHLI